MVWWYYFTDWCDWWDWRPTGTSVLILSSKKSLFREKRIWDKWAKSLFTCTLYCISCTYWEPSGGDWKYLKRRCLSCCLANSVKTLNKWTIVWVKRLIWWKSTENITENIRYINVAVAFTHFYAFLSETPQILRENNRATFRPHRSRSTTYVDAAYCYRRSSVVRPSVCHDRQPRKKTAESTDMPFGFDSGESKEELL